MIKDFIRHKLTIGKTKYEYPTNHILMLKVNEVIAEVNTLRSDVNTLIGKKPKSTNIALRQRIAEMETALKHIIGISGAGLSAQERIADIKEMAKCGLDPQYSPILVGRYTYSLKTETSVVE